MAFPGIPALVNPQPRSSVEHLRLLLVEDDAEDVLILSDILADGPVKVDVTNVARLAEALERLQAEAFDVVVADLSLPDSQGIGTFEQLYAHAPHTPIVVLSGLVDEALALRTLEIGAQDYLVKGQVDQALLVRSLRYAMRRAESDRIIEEERNLLRSVIDNLVDAIYVKDINGTYLLGNVAHAHQLGFASPSEVVGKTMNDLFPAEVAKRFRADDERVLETGKPILNRHEIVDDGRGPVRWLSTTKVPLISPTGKLLGLIGIGRDITGRKQAEEQVARYTRELQEKNAVMQDDLEMAREVQQAFLPQQYPTFPRSAAPEQSTIRFHSKYLPTTTLGGDFFHVLPISDTEAGVLICDVMGHGVRAALVTAIQRALVEELTAYAGSPGEFLTRMNEAFLSILRRTRSPMFASAFYVVVNASTLQIRYANAGHPKPLLLRPSTRQVQSLEGPGARPGPALGVFGDSRYEEQERAVEARDLLMLFTDGLYEVENSRGEFYDQRMLIEAVQRRVEHPAESLFDTLLEEVRTFSSTRDFIDDVCLVGVKIVPSEIPASAATSRRPK